MELVCYSTLCKVSRRSLPFLLGDYIINMSWASIISRAFMCVSECSGSKVLTSKLEHWLSAAWVTAFSKPWIGPQGPCVFLEISSSCNWEMEGLKQCAPHSGKPKGRLGRCPPPVKGEVWHTPFHVMYKEIAISCKCPPISSRVRQTLMQSCKCFLFPCKFNWIIFFDSLDFSFACNLRLLS